MTYAKLVELVLYFIAAISYEHVLSGQIEYTKRLFYYISQLC